MSFRKRGDRYVYRSEFLPSMRFEGDRKRNKKQSFVQKNANIHYIITLNWLPVLYVFVQIFASS